MTDIERRSGGMTSVDSEGKHVIGYAAVFNSRSGNLGGFTEEIRPGSFRRSLESSTDIRALLDHDSRLVLGRRSAGTLKLSEDDRGLMIDITMPDTSYARDVAELLKRGDVSQMSFGFSVPPGSDIWGEGEGGIRHRTLTECNLAEVSIVTFPAYEETSCAIRSLARHRMQALRNAVRVLGLKYQI